AQPRVVRGRVKDDPAVRTGHSGDGRGCGGLRRGGGDLHPPPAVLCGGGATSTGTATFLSERSRPRSHRRKAIWTTSVRWRARPRGRSNPVAAVAASFPRVIPRCTSGY